MSRWLVVSVLAVGLMACGSGDDTDDVSNGRPSNLNGPCEDGGDCGTGEFCFTDETLSATCLAVPDACADDPCGECDEMEDLCAEESGGSACFSIGSRVDFECFAME